MNFYLFAILMLCNSPLLRTVSIKYSIEIQKEKDMHKNLKERVKFINFVTELESVYFERSCQNWGF